MFNKRSAIFLLGIGAAISFCLAVTGCNENSGPDQRQAAEPARLNAAADATEAQHHPASVNNPFDKTARADTDGANSSEILLAQKTTEAPGEAEAADDPWRPVYAKLEEMLKAREAGKTVDFRPIADQISAGLATKFDVEAFQFAQDAARVFEMSGAPDAAKQVYNAMRRSADTAQQPQLGYVAKEIAAAGLKRLNLLGTNPTIQGTVFGGEKFDWAKYKGKVVLIDFWATWCGPCMHELPNIKKAYEQYHTQGFDVVGISLDEDKDALTEFLDKEKLPWKTLFDDDPAKHGFEGVKLAQEFGIDAIPATFLVDQKGKIVSISARGQQLTSQLQKLLGKN